MYTPLWYGNNNVMYITHAYTLKVRQWKFIILCIAMESYIYSSSKARQIKRKCYLHKNSVNSNRHNWLEIQYHGTVRRLNWKFTFLNNTSLWRRRWMETLNNWWWFSPGKILARSTFLDSTPKWSRFSQTKQFRLEYFMTERHESPS